MAILEVGADGKAPKGARVGDTIRTAGGDYKITGGTDGNWSSEKVAPRQNQNNAIIAAAYNNGSNSAAARAYEQDLRASQKAQERALNASINQGVGGLRDQKRDVRKAYDNSTRQAYINNMQSQRMMPQQLANAGITGGAAESTMISSQNAYEKNVQSAADAKNQALNDIDVAIRNLRSSGDIQQAQMIANNSAQIANAYMQASMQDIARNDTRALQEAELLGTLNGQQTLAAQQAAYNQALATAKQTGDYSYMKQFGWTDEQVKSANDMANASMNRGYSGGGGGSSYSTPSNNTSYSNLSEEAPNNAGSNQGNNYDTNGGLDPNMYDWNSIAALGLGPVDLNTISAKLQNGELTYRVGENGKLIIERNEAQTTQPTLPTAMDIVSGNMFSN